MYLKRPKEVTKEHLPSLKTRESGQSPFWESRDWARGVKELKGGKMLYSETSSQATNTFFANGCALNTASFTECPQEATQPWMLSRGLGQNWGVKRGTDSCRKT